MDERVKDKKNEKCISEFIKIIYNLHSYKIRVRNPRTTLFKISSYVIEIENILVLRVFSRFKF